MGGGASEVTRSTDSGKSIDIAGTIIKEIAVTTPITQLRIQNATDLLRPTANERIEFKGEVFTIERAILSMGMSFIDFCLSVSKYSLLRASASLISPLE